MFDDADIRNAKKVEPISFEIDPKEKLPAIAKLAVLLALILSMISVGVPRSVRTLARTVSAASGGDSQTIIIKDSKLENVTINQRINKK